MAINYVARYPGQVDAASASYPEGEPRNVVTAGDGTGTPLERDHVADIWGLLQAALGAGGLAANGTPDTATASQYLDGIRAGARRDSGVLSWQRSTGIETDGSYGNGAGSFVPTGAAYDSITGTWLLVGGSVAEKASCNASITGGRDFIRYDDGLSGTADPVAIAVRSVAGAGGQVAVSVTHDNTIQARTLDTDTAWSAVTPAGTPNQIYAVTLVPGTQTFIVIGRVASGDAYVATSDGTGTVWTDRTAAASGVFGGNTGWGSVAAQNSIVVAAPRTASTGIAVSSDAGVTWVASTTVLASAVYTVIWNPARGAFTAVAVGTVSGGTVQAYESVTGAVWTDMGANAIGLDIVGCENAWTPSVGALAPYGTALVLAGRITAPHADLGVDINAVVVSLDGGLSWSDPIRLGNTSARGVYGTGDSELLVLLSSGGGMICPRATL